MSIIGEAILSVSIELLFKKLTSAALLQFARQERIEGDLKKWERLLLRIRAVLEDAQEKQTTMKSVKIWLGELRSLASDVEKILDEFEAESLRRKSWLEPQAHEVQGRTSMVRKLIPSCFTSLSPRSFKFNSMMRSKMEEISVRLQDIVSQKNLLDLIENSGGSSGKVRERLPTTSLVNEANVYGRDRDTEVIIEMLLRDENASDGVQVLPVVGMEGVGKTTLAQLVYNDVRVKEHFDLRAWAWVSDDFDVVRVTKTILSSISDVPVEGSDLNLLQVKLKEKLFRKKFLFVLDDVWSENYDDWTVQCRPFEASYPGSRIIFTTRNQGVSSMMGTLPTYPLKRLSNDDCLCVFTQHALRTQDFSKHENLKKIGEQIVKRCNGLPLVAKTIAGLLRGKYDPHDWEDMLNSNSWDLPEEEVAFYPHLD